MITYFDRFSIKLVELHKHNCQNSSLSISTVKRWKTSFAILSLKRKRKEIEKFTLEGSGSASSEGSDGSESESGGCGSSCSSSPSASGSGSGSSSRSASGRSERFECASLLGQRLTLPRELCKDPKVFRELVSLATWESLSEANVRHLKRFLPSFPENDADEKEATVRKLFARETFKFSSPLVEFHRKLKSGAYEPDASRLRRSLRKCRAKRALRRRRRAAVRDAPALLLKRERLLALAHALPPGAPPPRWERERQPSHRQNFQSPLSDARSARDAVVCRRYFQELADVRRQALGDSDGVSDDENYPEGPPPELPKSVLPDRAKHSQILGRTIVSTLSDRANSMNSAVILNDEWKRRALILHKQRRYLCSNNAELVTTGITLGSVKSRTGCTFVKEEPFAPDSNRARSTKSNKNTSKASRKMSQSLFTPSESTSEEDIKPNLTANVILPTSSASVSSSHPLPLSSPVSIKVENILENSVDEEAGLQLVQATHACFLSVIRDLVCSTPKHCLPLSALETRVRNWRQNPIAPLNHWYSSVEDWVKALPSAVCFLTGDTAFQPDDYVPYLQYKPVTQVYQWIGAGRDTDALLMPLCALWLSHRQTSPAIVPSTVRSPLLFLETVEGLGSQLNSKWNSRWQVSNEELEAFRSQEAMRFQRPHRAFTYHLPRGQVVVGPLRGVYGCDEPGGNTSRGARGHLLLAPTRPRHVTLLALVRDAVACLPGGEGTRAHITALLRRSQYLVPDAGEQALQAAVSGALDRMHGAPDPCVHYLPARKMWAYLHGNRTEEEFERLHAESQLQSKSKAMASVQQKRNVTNSKSKLSRPTKNTKSTNSTESISGNTVIEEETENEDVNVDVESSENSVLSPTVNVSTSSVTTTTTTSAQSQPLEKVTVMSGTSLLQSKLSVTTSTQQVFKRNPNSIQTNSPRSMIRMLSSSTPGKSLISPRALQSNTPPPAGRTAIQTKVVVQKPGQTTGALTPGQQRRLLESLMRHQRQHGQPMSRDQLLHTINSTQKTATSSTTITQKPTAPVSQPMQLTGQTVQLSSGQTVQLTSQTVQLTGQAMQLTGQAVQIGGQTVQIAGQSVQLVGQPRTVTESPNRQSSQKPSTPLVAKILTNAHIRNTSTATTSSANNGLRLSGLSFGQLQGKPLLLQTSTSNKSSNILLQTSGSTANSNSVNVSSYTEPKSSNTRPLVSTAQHTLLLSNLGGQVVRVAGPGTLIGPALRLQTPANQVQGGSGVLLSNTLKLQTTPIRLHQGNTNSGTGRVLLAGGTRLHGLKLLPVQHSVTRGGNINARQVYARLVNPATVSGTITTTTTTNSLIGHKNSTTAAVVKPPSPKKST